MIKAVVRDIVNRDTLYAVLGGIILTASVLAALDLFGVREMNDTAYITWSVLMLVAWIGRAFIRVSKRKDAEG